MDSAAAANIYFVWGVDDAPYGPIELATLVDWIRDERVLPDTWIFSRSASQWQMAAHLPELSNYLTTTLAQPIEQGLKPGMLRRIKILAELKDAQLAHLADFMEAQQVGEQIGRAHV